MCRRIECERCGKPSFAGCGMHVEQVLQDVTPAERCRCRELAHEAHPAERTKRSSWLRKLLR